MKRVDVVIVREDDPRCSELEAEGYEVVGYSWGANLRFDESSDLAMFEERVRQARNEGFNIRELSTADLAEVGEVEFANVNDYPLSAATRHELPTLEHLVAWFMPAFASGVCSSKEDWWRLPALNEEISDGTPSSRQFSQNTADEDLVPR